MLLKNSAAKFDTIEYHPGRAAEFSNDDNLRTLNPYQPPVIAPVDGIVGPFVDHVGYLYDNDSDAIGTALNYLAFLVQRGGEVWAPVHVNEREGTGRGWLFALIARMLGQRNVFFADGDRLTGKFNAWMLTTQLLIVPQWLAPPKPISADYGTGSSR